MHGIRSSEGQAEPPGASEPRSERLSDSKFRVLEYTLGTKSMLSPCDTQYQYLHPHDPPLDIGAKPARAPAPPPEAPRAPSSPT
eukprot:745650-Hanusia_phi.AAC.1